MNAPDASPPPAISVVIPTHNGRDMLTVCLESLSRQTFQDFETIVVDNGSSDGTREFLESQYPGVRGIYFDEALGFAKPANAGIHSARGEFVALLNNDTQVDPNWLRALKDRMDAYPELGSCASKMLGYDERHILDGAGDVYVRRGDAFRLGHGLPDGEAFENPYRVFGPCGGAALYRKSVLDEVGDLDEDFFMYYEDVDLNFRVQLAGYPCDYVPEAVIYHIGSASSGGGQSPKVTELIARNSLYVIFKNYPWPLLLVNLPRIIRARRLFVTHYRNLGQEMGSAYVRGLKSAFKRIGDMLRKRRSIQRQRKISLNALSQLFRQSEKHMRRHNIICR